jgi:hypothetical protein
MTRMSVDKLLNGLASRWVTLLEADPATNRRRDMSASSTHHPPEFKHPADMEWEMGRFGNVTKFLFHPRPERPTEPNAGFLKYARVRPFHCTGTTSRRSVHR